MGGLDGITDEQKLKVEQLYKELAEYAKLDKDVRIVGHIDRFEIWNPKIYDQYMMKEKPDKSRTIKLVFRPTLRKQKNTDN